jgi:erythromycin esterase
VTSYSTLWRPLKNCGRFPARCRYREHSRAQARRFFAAASLALCRLPDSQALTHSKLVMNSVIVGLASLTLLGACASPATAQQPSDSFVRWAKAHAVPLRSVEAGVDDSDLSVLATMVGKARVVALGEATHGAHEPLALRNRIFEFLVKQMGFTAIAIESGLPESRRVQEFVLGGPGRADSVALEGLTYGFGDLQENVALIQWMHDYNANPLHASKIRFYGIDLSAAAYDTASAARVVVDETLLYIARVDPASAQRMRKKLNQNLSGFSSAGYPALPAADRDRLSASIDELLALLKRKRPALVALTSSDEYEWALRKGESARELNAAFRATPPAMEDGSLPPTAYREMNVRDSVMAVNLEWALKREGRDGRMFLFAHNGHVMSGTLRGSIWKALAQDPTPMGAHLRRSLKDQLLTIVTSSANNGPGLPTAPLDSTSIDAALARVGLPLFLLDIRGAGQNAGAASWLSQRHSLRMNFKAHLEVLADSALDAFIFVDTLTQSR